MQDADSKIRIRPKTSINDRSDSRRIIRKSKNNPFVIPPVAELLAGREDEQLQLKEERETIRSMTLKQRAELLRPPIPEYLLHSSKKASGNSSSLIGSSYSTTNMSKTQTPNSQKGKRPKTRGSFFITNHQLINGDFEYDDGFEISEKFKHGRSYGNDHSSTSSCKSEGRRITEFIQEKREIYHIQMLMDRKNFEIQRLNKQICNEEAALLEQEQNIEESSQSYKIQNTKVESDLARARKRMEEATRKRVESTKKLKLFKQQVELMTSEINKNLDILDEYQSYRIFLESITPDGKTVEDCYKNPEDLLTEIESVENDNLFLIKQCQSLMDIEGREEKNLKESIEKANGMIEKAQSNISNVEEVPLFNFDNTSILETQNEIENELKRISGLVTKLYFNCYKKDTNSTTIGILEKLENDLEDMYRKIDMIDRKFVTEKQSMIDKRRREQQRKEKLERQAIEQKMKTDQALKRATQPIKRQTGRPLYERTSPIKVRKTNDAKLLAQRLEQQRVESLLYGELYP